MHLEFFFNHILLPIKKKNGLGIKIVVYRICIYTQLLVLYIKIVYI